VIAEALERLGEPIPAMPGEEGEPGVDARAADALVAIARAAALVDAYEAPPWVAAFHRGSRWRILAT
jgi:hypothetical protein